MNDLILNVLLSRGGSMLGSLLYFAFIIALLVGMWKTFEKMGLPGWGAIIPIYNIYLLLDKIGKPVWWLVLFLIPFVNIVIAFIVYNEVSKGFGRGLGMTILMFFGIGWLVLGFGDAVWGGSEAPAEA